MPVIYPRFYGNPIKMRKYFRLRKQYPIGDPLRYPVALKMPYPVHVSFGRYIGPKEGLVINTDEAIKNSANKVLTKKIWSEHNQKPDCVNIPFITQYYTHESLLYKNRFYDITNIKNDGFPFMAKLFDASRGKGMVYLSNEDDFIDFIQNNNYDKTKYFYEKFFEATSEYRVHFSPHLKDRSYHFSYQNPDGTTSVVTSNGGAFLAVKKLMNREAYNTAMDENGYVTRNMSDDIIFSTQFNPPRIWPEIIKSGMAAIEALGLDFGFLDIMYNSETRQFVFSESGSNPGMGRLQDDEDAINITAQIYQKALVHIIINKAQSDPNFKLLVPCAV
jgi:hypothetical protein